MRESAGLFNPPFTHLYADRFQGMGRHRARSRRRVSNCSRSARAASVSRASTSRSSTTASSCIRRSTTSATTWCGSPISPRLRRALEEGVWPEGEPPARALTMDGGIPQPDRVRIRAWAEVAGAWTITDRRALDALSPFHVWTTDYAEKRLCVEAPAPAARPAAAHVPHPAPGDGPGPRGLRAAAARGWRSPAICPSRARRCCRTRSSSGPPKRSRPSPRPTAPRPTRSAPRSEPRHIVSALDGAGVGPDSGSVSTSRRH